MPVLTKCTFAVRLPFILHSLTFYFIVFLFAQRELFLVCRVFFLLSIISEKKSEMNCLWLYGICSPHVKNGPLLFWSTLLCIWLLLLAFYISLLFIRSVHNAKCWSYKACAHSHIRYDHMLFSLSLSMFKTVFPLYADRDLLLFVSKSRKTEMFISQIIFFVSVFVVSFCFLRSRFVCFFLLCVFHLSSPIRCLHARLGISHKSSAKQFQKSKEEKKNVLANVNHSRFHLRYGMHYSIVHTYSLTKSEEFECWLLIFTRRGLWKLCKWAASILLCVRMWFAFIVWDFFVFHRHHYRCIWNCSSGRFKWKSHDTAHRRAQSKEKTRNDILIEMMTH